MNMNEDNKQVVLVDERRVQQLVYAVNRRAPLDAVQLLERESDELVASVLEQLESTLAMRILANMDLKRAEMLTPIIQDRVGEQWLVNQSYPEDSIGRIMEPPIEAFRVDMLVKDVVNVLRESSVDRQIVYAYAVDKEMKLMGVIVMRDLLFARSYDCIEDIMVEQPFYFRASSSIGDAMRAVLLRHYPIYPVCDEDCKLVGFIRGYALFERRTYELTAHSGQMVGVVKEEHVTTPWLKCLFMRHPWLQLNLLTAFVAGAVVGFFDETIAQVVVLAAFLPVLAGQSGNTGCQALAVTLRGLTLNELKPGMERKVVIKEGILGLCNGVLVGITAALGMFIYASSVGSEVPVKLAFVVLLAMLGSCIASGVTGVMIPLILRRLGADPVTASTIFLTTATDVISMGLLLILASIVIL
ncbi:MAG: magnesium transporter [Proteobacteria bacterium]|nr:magnesium transporter [Pseudomonadota bacterium]